MSGKWLGRVRDPEFWRELCPDLTISERSLDAGLQVDTPEVPTSDLVQRFITDGYFDVPGVLAPDHCQRLSDGVRRVVEAGFEAPFAIVYDEYWHILRQAWPAIHVILGDDPRVIPEFWIWYVDGNNESAGWTPHRDTETVWNRPDGMPDAITMWMPLVDVDPTNSCMYVLPKSHDPDYPFAMPEPGVSTDSLPYIRALPARAGTAICWDLNILHWGAAYTSYAKTPRVSIAWYLQRGDADLFSLQALTLDTKLSFEDRLTIIGHNLFKYPRFRDRFSTDTNAFAEQFGSYYRTLYGPAARASRR